MNYLLVQSGTQQHVQVLSPCDAFCSMEEFITEGTSAVHASAGLKQEWFAECSVKSNTEGNSGSLIFFSTVVFLKLGLRDDRKEGEGAGKASLLPCTAKLMLLYIASCKGTFTDM